MAKKMMLGKLKEAINSCQGHNFLQFLPNGCVSPVFLRLTGRWVGANLTNPPEVILKGKRHVHSKLAFVYSAFVFENVKRSWLMTRTAGCTAVLYGAIPFSGACSSPPAFAILAKRPWIIW
jgi:hypothetical protein